MAGEAFLALFLVPCWNAANPNPLANPFLVTLASPGGSVPSAGDCDCNRLPSSSIELGDRAGTTPTPGVGRLAMIPGVSSSCISIPGLKAMPELVEEGPMGILCS